MDKYKPTLSELNKFWRRTLYSKIENIFEYENLPAEINERALKLGLFIFGKLIFYKIEDKFLVQKFSYTDKLDWYYIPLHGRVVNPWLPQGHQNKEFTLNDEAIIWNTTPDMYAFKERSLVSDLIFKTAAQLSENDISYYCIQRNHRLIAVLTANDDKQRAEANIILGKMYNGDSEIVMKEDLVNHINVNPISQNATRSPLTELIEFQQYVLANFYHSFGINSNYNLKREQLNSNEIDVNREVLRLNIEDMLKCRQKGFEKVNEIYGLNIRVHLNDEVYKTLLQESQVPEVGLNDEIREDKSESSSSSSEEGTGDESNNELDRGTEGTDESVRNDETTTKEIPESTEDKGDVSEGINIQINIEGDVSNLRTDEDTNSSDEETNSSDEEQKESDEKE